MMDDDNILMQSIIDFQLDKSTLYPMRFTNITATNLEVNYY